MMTYNSDIEKRNTWKPPRPQINTTIDAGIHKLAKENNIQWNDALEFGVQFLLAEKDLCEYPHSDKINRMVKKIEELNEEILALDSKLSQQMKFKKEIYPEKSAEEEADEILKKEMGANEGTS